SFFHLFLMSDTSTTGLYTLSLHDALPDLAQLEGELPELEGEGEYEIAEWMNEELDHLRSKLETSDAFVVDPEAKEDFLKRIEDLDRKSTRLNSSHVKISYAVFCLKKKNNM